MYARGILFGKMKYELGDHSFVRCPESGLMADLEFKTKGYFGGTYNAIGGYIKETKTDKALYELSGLWNGEMYIKNLTVCLAPFPSTSSDPHAACCLPLRSRSALSATLTHRRPARRSCSLTLRKPEPHFL